MTDGAPTAWVLNLDADRELARPERFQRRKANQDRIEALIPNLRPLIGPDARLVRDGDAEGAHEGCIGKAWCPTPSALRALTRVGATIAAVPELAVLRRVNHRAFCTELGPMLPGARFLDDFDAIVATLSEPTPSGSWLLKLPYGFAGTGRLPIFVGRLTDGERGWIRQSLSKGGLQVEPLVDRLADFSIHGTVAPDGTLRLGVPVRQEVSPGGVWESACLPSPSDLAAAERLALLDEAERVGRALFEAGYFGPYGVDAFRYRWGDETRLCSRCEINARYTMSWALGMGLVRPS